MAGNPLKGNSDASEFVATPKREPNGVETRVSA